MSGKIKILLNGVEYFVEEGKFLIDVMKEKGFDPNNYVCVLNDNVVSKSMVYQTKLYENDRLEILTIMGGG